MSEKDLAQKIRDMRELSDRDLMDVYEHMAVDVHMARMMANFPAYEETRPLLDYTREEVHRRMERRMTRVSGIGSF